MAITMASIIPAIVPTIVAGFLMIVTLKKMRDDQLSRSMKPATLVVDNKN